MSQLIDDLLAFSRIGRTTLRKAPIDLNGLVRAVVAELQPEFKSRKVDWTLQQLPYTSGDRALLHQVFLNLLANAVKYTRTRAEARIQVFAVEQDDELIVGVKDNGVGFDPAYRDKLFGVFQRLHSATDFEGTGVGLANVRRIVQRHGGRTWAESMLNEGATFYFSLPAPDKAEYRDARAGRDGREAPADRRGQIAALCSHWMSTGAARQIGRECAIDDDLVTHGRLGVT